jgi:FkbM family methyltransferase
MKDKVILYGVNSINIERAMIYVTKELQKEVIFVSDRDTELHNKYFFGVKCIAPEELKYKDATVLLCNGFSIKSVEASMSQLGVNDYVSAYKFVSLNEHKKLSTVYELLEDEFSKDTFKKIIEARITSDTLILNKVMLSVKDRYFDFFNVKTHIFTYVDIGAYNGVTIENFLMRFCNAQKIFAFEPMDTVFCALSVRAERLEKEYATSIICENMCLSDYDGTAKMDESRGDFCAHIKIREGNKKVTSLDKYLKGEKVDYIKCDAEGEELNILSGAKETISRYKPKLAICVDHKVWDLYEVPLLIKQINPSYKFALMLYSDSLNEYVIYAY